MKFPPFKAFEITDSRGLPTLGLTADWQGEEVVSRVPAGTSAGSHEARPLPVDEALVQAASLSNTLVGREYASVADFDQTLFNLDGTVNKAKLGANTILGLSMLYCRLAAKEAGQELWEWLRGQWQQLGGGLTRAKHRVIPMMVMIEGGVHAESGPQIQELLVNGLPAAGQAVWEVLDRQGYARGMEGGFDIPYHQRETADHAGLTEITTAITTARAAVSLSIDVAANELTLPDRYDVPGIIGLAKEFKLESVEDPFAEDDWESWARLVRELAGRRLSTAVIGDDLTVTNVNRLEEALAKQALTGVIVKPNQVGSISETLRFTALAKERGLQIIVSHRSGETTDDYIADLAVAVQADYLKAGAPSQPERQAKYQRLAVIEEQLSVIAEHQITKGDDDS